MDGRDTHFGMVSHSSLNEALKNCENMGGQKCTFGPARGGNLPPFCPYKLVPKVGIRTSGVS